MGKRKPLESGRVFGELTLLRGVGPDARGRTQAEFRCSCGSVLVRVVSRVRTGHIKSCGHLRGGGFRALDLVGQSFGRLKAVERSPDNTPQGGAIWRCECECGASVEVPVSRLRSGITRSCGCLALEHASQMGRGNRGKRSHNWKGVGELSGTFWGQIQLNASSRGLALKVTQDGLWSLFLAQEGLCALSGKPLSFDSVGLRGDGNASLDRIDSAEGYVPGNVQWVDKMVQQMKWDFPQDEFLRMCALITERAKNHVVAV
jgi:hypothetical protein